MKPEDVLGLMVPVTFVFFLVTERLFPRRQYPPIRFWNLIGFAGLIMTGVITTVLPALLPETLTTHHMFDGARLGHQLHHSPRRLDIPGSAFFHPLDIALQTLPATLMSVFVLGLSPFTAGLVGYVAAFYGMFQHWNVKTPRWLGYVIQRPEAHGLHHELGVHAWNYSDFPLWDIVMGTFRNPETFDGDVGFAGEAPSRIGAMLLFQDVNAD